MTTAHRLADAPPMAAMGSPSDVGSLGDLVPEPLRQLLEEHGQKAIPLIARDPSLGRLAESASQSVETSHELHNADARSLEFLADDSIHLVVTSPPYWTLKEYDEADGQLGSVSDYDSFLDELDKVWTEALRVLVPGGRLVVVVGDVCLSRKKHGRHMVYPLHSSIQERCRALGFDNLTPIIWHKIANARLEVENGSGFLGKPYEPNAVVKNDMEFILFQRKAGGYRQPGVAARLLSVIPQDRHKKWYQQIWTLPGASTRNHPAPFPMDLAERLVRMFSFVGDTVLDPFTGTGTTNLAARAWGRNSIGVEVCENYIEIARTRLQSQQLRLGQIG